MAGRNILNRKTRLGLCLSLLLLPASNLLADDFAQQRQQLVEEIGQSVRDTSLYLDKEALDPRVMAAIARVPRHAFVPSDLIGRAYHNRPLPIGEGQTISQPFIVAAMSDRAGLALDSRVLEVGSGWRQPRRSSMNRAKRR